MPDARRALRIAAALACVAAVDLCSAQPAKVVRIGMLSSLTPDAPRAAFFREGLAQRGYIEGRNITIEWRPSHGLAERFPALAQELARAKVDIIVASDNPAIAAAKAATRTIPIVMVTATDPVGTGFVASLARPGGNITGLTFIAPELQGKAVEVLKEALPHAKRVAILWSPAEPGRQAVADQALVAARSLGLQSRLAPLASAADLASLFDALEKERTDAVIVQASQVTFAQRRNIAELAAARRISTMGWSSDVVDAGILISYGASLPELYHRSGYYVARIIAGAKPADLPVEQPAKFELAVNLVTARRLRLTLPSSVMARADRIIQ